MMHQTMKLKGLMIFSRTTIAVFVNASILCPDLESGTPIKREKSFFGPLTGSNGGYASPENNSESIHDRKKQSPMPWSCAILASLLIANFDLSFLPLSSSTPNSRQISIHSDDVLLVTAVC